MVSTTSGMVSLCGKENVQEEEEDDDVFSLQFFDREEKVVVEQLHAPTDFSYEVPGFIQDEELEGFLAKSITFEFQDSNDLGDPVYSSLVTPKTEEKEVKFEDLLQDDITPDEVMDPPRRRRGRRPKSEAALYPLYSRRRKPQKSKLYEVEPFDDEEKERKRRNAITAKKHREKEKNHLTSLRNEVDQVKKEKDELSEKLKLLQESTTKLEDGLDRLKKRISLDFELEIN